MEKMENICRTCLRCPEILLPLFDETELPLKIETISSIVILKTDDLPLKICAECIININLCYNFRNVIINSDQELKQRLLTLLDQDEGISEADKLEFVHIKVKTEYVDLTEEEDPLVDRNTHAIEDMKEENGETEMVTDESAKAVIDKKHNFTFKVQPSFRSKKNHGNHSRNHLITKSMCNICGKTVRTDNLKKHISIHTGSPIPCNECGKICKNSESLRSHVLIHKGLVITCEFCGQIYKNRAGYHRHIRKKHTLGARKIKCHLCDKMFLENADLKIHLRSHTGERPYPCQYCKKGFSSSNALKTHVRQHTNERPYTCSFCPMAFPQNVSLRTHMKSKHSVSI